MRVSSNQLFSSSLSHVLSLQQSIQKYQLQVATGKRSASPADDPIGAAESMNLDDRLVALQQFDRNANLANLRLAEQETAIEATQNTLQRVRELVLQSKTRALTTADRRFIAAEVGERLNEVLNLANGKNASGEYLFAGTAVNVTPFTADTAGNIQYNGNQIVRELAITDGRKISEGLSGAEVFMGVRNGNGTFVANLNAGNTGTGRVINDVVVTSSAVTTDSFNIVFTAPTTFNLVNATTGATVLAAQPYTDGASIAFNGVSLGITGKPAAGDQFSIGPSQNQSVFATIAKAKADMSVDLTSDKLSSDFSFNLDRALAEIDNSLETMNVARAEIGSRQNAITSQIRINGDVKLELETVKSNVEDVDLASAISQLARYSQTLEAAQQAFVKVQGLSLFNFLR